MKRFVIVVDMQRDFVAPDGALPVEDAPAIVDPLAAWLATLRPADTAGVLFTQDTHNAATYADTAEAAEFPLHCARGTPGWALVLDPHVVAPGVPVHVLEKGVFDMWAEPGRTLDRIDTAERVERDAFFAGLRSEGIDEVTVVGVAADYCVRWAIEGLVARGFRVAVPAALTRGIARQIDAVAAAEWRGAPVLIDDGR